MGLPKGFVERAAEQSALSAAVANEKVRPRAGYVLVRKVRREKVGAVAVSERSQEGWLLLVEAVGPGVDGLKAGDRVLVGSGVDLVVDGTGAVRINPSCHYDVPGHPDLALMPERAIICVVESEV